ncbi:uncharacterized protein B0H18DRAFT_671004 [Fomitopsis serialis]|uniref:uncharacterized protein n=1 Tax=Fomitopsis serialis TaxID=139415 RepID=UPI0020078435|nr:uncharacterized protein B0H18DRAFT_671004 [Neoantrodia serialis]KAH9932899.1 hypothetical protein B0H18DRAFT_671004 [Neoantrodia serialis]
MPGAIICRRRIFRRLGWLPGCARRRSTTSCVLDFGTLLASSYLVSPCRVDHLPLLHFYHTVSPLPFLLLLAGDVLRSPRYFVCPPSFAPLPPPLPPHASTLGELLRCINNHNVDYLVVSSSVLQLYPIYSVRQRCEVARGAAGGGPYCYDRPCLLFTPLPSEFIFSSSRPVLPFRYLCMTYCGRLAGVRCWTAVSVIPSPESVSAVTDLRFLTSPVYIIQHIAHTQHYSPILSTRRALVTGAPSRASGCTYKISGDTRWSWVSHHTPTTLPRSLNPMESSCCPSSPNTYIYNNDLDLCLDRRGSPLPTWRVRCVPQLRVSGSGSRVSYSLPSVRIPTRLLRLVVDI